MTPTKTRPGTAPPRDPLAGWQARTPHTITCPSGQRLRMVLPGVATLLEHGDLPDDLARLAVAEITRDDGAAGMVADEVRDIDPDEARAKLAEFGRFQRALACSVIRELETPGGWVPITLELDQLDGLPEDDIAMVAAIVQRLRNVDARGVTIGVEPLDRWRLFRDAHGCPGDGEDCEGCRKVIEAVSSSDVGGV